MPSGIAQSSGSPHSSVDASSAHVMPVKQDKWVSQCMSILDYLFDHEESDPFHEPVNYEELGLWDYPKIIKHPMDLGTIQVFGLFIYICGAV